MQKGTKNLTRIILASIAIIPIIFLANLGYLYTPITYIAVLIIIVPLFFIFRKRKMGLRTPTILLITSIIIAASPFLFALVHHTIFNDNHIWNLMWFCLFTFPIGLAGVLASIICTIKSQIDDRKQD